MIHVKDNNDEQTMCGTDGWSAPFYRFALTTDDRCPSCVAIVSAPTEENATRLIETCRVCPEALVSPFGIQLCAGPLGRVIMGDGPEGASLNATMERQRVARQAREQAELVLARTKRYQDTKQALNILGDEYVAHISGDDENQLFVLRIGDKRFTFTNVREI